jgi:hypothetical protein
MVSFKSSGKIFHIYFLYIYNTRFTTVHLDYFENIKIINNLFIYVSLLGETKVSLETNVRGADVFVSIIKILNFALQITLDPIMKQISSRKYLIITILDNSTYMPTGQR